MPWSPNPGAQTRAMTELQDVRELCYFGNRGGGKTTTLIYDFICNIGKFGDEYKGLVYKRTHPELRPLSEKFLKEIVKIWTFDKEVFYKLHPHIQITWISGETLEFKAIMKPDDYLKLHGQEYVFICTDELVNYPDSSVYNRSKSLLRTTNPKIPKKIRSTTNSWGPGYHWVKEMFQPFEKLDIVRKIPRSVLNQKTGKYKVSYHSRIMLDCPREENTALLEGSPEYEMDIDADCEHNEEMRKSWMIGGKEAWNLVGVGGMFQEWDPNVHIIPYCSLPTSWYRDRTFDWGYSAPYAVLYFAESDGTPYINQKGKTVPTRKGDLFIFSEIYGCHPKHPAQGIKHNPVEIAKRVREMDNRLDGVIYDGAADWQINNNDGRGSIAKQMRDSEYQVTWLDADKSDGSRKDGWQKMITMFAAAKDPMRETPGLFVMDNCYHFIRTVPVLMKDEKKPDDIDQNMCDHLADCCRYRVHGRSRAKVTKLVGFY